MRSPRHLLNFGGIKTLPVIMQTEASECGLACLAMIASFHGFKTDLAQLRHDHSISLKGASLASLMGIADTLKLSTRALRLDLHQLPQLKLPCILHWDMNHFVVLKKVSGNNVEIHDPALGNRRYSFSELSKHFTGVALELAPTKSFTPKDTRVPMRLSDFWSTIRGLGSTLTNVLVLSLLLQLFVIASPYYMQLVVDDVLQNGDKQLLFVLAIGFGILMLVELITRAVRSTLLLHFSNLMSIQLSANLFHHLIRLPVAYFEKRHIGDVVSRFGALQQIRSLLTEGVIEAIVDGIMAVTTLFMIFLYSPLLSAVVLCAIAIYAIVRGVMYRPMRQMSEEVIVNQAKEQSNFMETVRGIQTIKLYGKEIQRQSVWHSHLAATLNSGIRVGHLTIGYQTFNKLVFGVENIIVIYLAAMLVMESQLSVGMLFAFMAYKRQFTEKTANLIEKYIQFRMLSLHFDRLADIALSEKESHLTSHMPSPPLKGSLQVKNVSFRYHESEPCLFNNLNFTIEAGGSVALVGPSGCGKTTLMKLMLGLFTPETGCISVDGIDIKKLGLHQYRQQIGVVMQDDQLLSGSIADNIAFFEPMRDMERIRWACNVAAINKDIESMVMGYNTLVGDMGTSLSGGQVQRLLLARALYKQPKILFMDEATSHLDTELEKSVNTVIKTLSITRIIIAHRPETIASADRVISLQEGRLIEIKNTSGQKPYHNANVISSPLDISCEPVTGSQDPLGNRFLLN